MANELITSTTKDLKAYLENTAIKKRFEDVLGKRAQAYMISILSIASQSDLLMKADPASVVNAAMTAATLDLPINQNLGFAYIIPYRGAAQFQMGYKGFIQLAQRSGQFATLNVSKVCDGEIETQDLLTGEIKFNWIKDHDEREKLPAVGYIAYMRLINGFEKSLYMSKKDLESHGVKYSQTYKKGFGLWKDNFDAMAKKTVIKLLLSKYAPLTTAMQKAQLADQSIIHGDDDYEYVDNQKERPEEVAKNKERERIINHINNSKTTEELVKCADYIAEDDKELKTWYENKLVEFEVNK